MCTASLSLSKIQWSRDKLKAAKGARSSGSGATSDSLDVVEAPAWWWPASSGPDLCFSSFFVMFAIFLFCLPFFCFVCHAYQSKAHDKDLTLCRASPGQAHGKAGGCRLKR
jgi:hypothetical protein